jgi:hypothetical protein
MGGAIPYSSRGSSPFLVNNSEQGKEENLSGSAIRSGLSLTSNTWQKSTQLLSSLRLHDVENEYFRSNPATTLSFDELEMVQS